MGLAIGIFHLILAGCLVGVSSDEDPRSIIQDAFWPAKLLVLGGSFLGTMWLPRSFLDQLFYPVVIMSILFLVAQSLLLVDVTYSIIGYCLDNGGFLLVLLKLISLGLYILIGYSSYLLWNLFESDNERLIVLISAIVTVVLAVCSLLPQVRERNERSGLFQASIIGTLSMVIIGSAIVYSPQHQIEASSGDNTLIIMTIIVTVLSGIFAVMAVLGAGYVGAAGKDGATGHSYNYSMFHLIFVFAAMYLVSSVTDWQMAVVSGNSLSFVDTGLAFWAKISLVGVINLFYGWTLIAPIVFKDREFDF